MLISSLAFADALNAYECLLELRIDTPAPLSSAAQQILIVCGRHGGYSTIPKSEYSYTDKNLINILPPKRTQKGHKKDTKSALLRFFALDIVFILVQS